MTKEGEGSMDLTDILKKKMHGVSDKEYLARQGQTKWMQAPSEHPNNNPLKAGKGRQMRKRGGKCA